MAIGRMARDGFQNDYEEAVRRGNAPSGYGNVVNAYGSVGRMGGAILIVEFEDGRTLSPYFNQSAYEPCGDSDDDDSAEDYGCQHSDAYEINEDAEEWADNMQGATELYEWEWTEPVGTYGY